jgi:hypothetical protein
LVQPEPIGTTNDALLLVTRQVYADRDAFLVHVFVKPENGERKFTISAFKPDPFSLNQTVFVELNDVIGRELMRQLSLIIKGNGGALVQCIISRNYFPSTETDAQSVEQEVDGDKLPEVSTLPEVSEDMLL